MWSTIKLWTKLVQWMYVNWVHIFSECILILNVVVAWILLIIPIFAKLSTLQLPLDCKKVFFFRFIKYLPNWKMLHMWLVRYDEISFTSWTPIFHTSYFLYNLWSTIQVPCKIKAFGLVSIKLNLPHNVCKSQIIKWNKFGR